MKNPPSAPTNRPNGPGEPSPGLRPQADALGKQATHPCGLKGRENLPPPSRALTGRSEVTTFFPRASLRSALGYILPARWAGWRPPDFFTGSETGRLHGSPRKEEGTPGSFRGQGLPEERRRDAGGPRGVATGSEPGARRTNVAAPHPGRASMAGLSDELDPLTHDSLKCLLAGPNFFHPGEAHHRSVLPKPLEQALRVLDIDRRDSREPSLPDGG